MISKKTFASYGITQFDQYFDLIIESLHNGQRKQAIEQFKALNKVQRIACLLYMLAQATQESPEVDTPALTLCIQNIY